MDIMDIPQERKLITEVPGPRSRALFERRTAAIPLGVANLHSIVTARAEGSDDSLNLIAGCLSGRRYKVASSRATPRWLRQSGRFVVTSISKMVSLPFCPLLS